MLGLFRHRAGSVAAIGALIVAALVVSVPMAASAHELGLSIPACTDTWIGGVDNNYGTAGNWSAGHVPGDTDDVCITGSTPGGDTYTVVANGNYNVHSLTLGGASGTQTLVIPAANIVFHLEDASTINTNGVLTLGDSGTGDSSLTSCGFLNQGLANNGHLNTVAGGSGTRFIVLEGLDNAAGGTVDIAGPTVDDSCGFMTNESTFTVEAGGSLTLIRGPGFQNSGGSLTNNGAFTVSRGGGNFCSGALCTFFQRGGTESGHPVVIEGATLDDDLGAGAASFTLTGATNLNGSGPSPGVAADQTVTIPADNSQALVSKSLTNAGTLTLGDGAAGRARSKAATGRPC
jgi:hypothetical protein